MSGRPEPQTVTTPCINVAPTALKPKSKRKVLTSRTQANVLIWILRALVHSAQTNSPYNLDKHKNNSRCFKHLMSACAALEIPKRVSDMVDVAQYAPALITQVQAVKLPPGCTELSVNAIMKRCAITRAEQQLLLFSITIHENHLLGSMFHFFFQKVTPGQFYKVLAYVLDEPVKNIQAALRADSFLSKAGMLSMDVRPVMGFEDRLDVGYGLSETLEIANGDWNEIVSGVCAKARPSNLQESDFSHIAKEWSLVLNYIKGAAATGRAGANILLHGPPGCGKTEFARAVLASSDLRGFELFIEQPNGHSMSSTQRRSYYRQANLYLQHEASSVLLVDEMDGLLDINSLEGNWRNPNKTFSKASANAQLESNPVPTIWITNNAEHLDSAQMRRFDLVLRFNPLGRHAIRRQLNDKLKKHGVSNHWIDTTSAAPELTPGLVNTLSLVAESLTQSKTGNTDMEEMLNISLRQRGIKVSRKAPQKYRIEYCNASLQIDVLTATMTAKHDARFLLYGGTGTGKTAFARHIADTLNLEPKLVRPSDILGAYVGQTEQNIANLFETTDPEESLIILDEFESLAANRKRARANWEVSMINEMLTQIEAYEGRVIACTNLINHIDPAIRRRFQSKVELLPLTQQQRSNLFNDSIRKLGLPNSTHHFASTELYATEHLAYGHFANALEVAEYAPNLTMNTFVELLIQELESTNGSTTKRIGFT